MRFITKFSWIFVIIFAGLIVYYSVILYDLLFRYPIPIPSRQITQNSLNLRELWRRNDVFLPGRSREKFSLLHATNSIIVFTNYNQNSSQSQLQVLDVESGQLVWEVSQPPRIRIHSLVVEDKYLYLAIDWQIQKYQISSGQLLWQTPGQPSERTGYRLVWLNKSLINYSTIVGESYFLMSVYNPITGVLMRQENIPIVPLLTTTQTEYQGDCRYLLAIDRPSGKVKWQTELGGCLDRQPVLTNSNLLVSTYTAFNSIAGLYLIDTNNGSVKWYALRDEIISNSIILDQVVYAIRRNGDIVGLDLDTGQEVGTIQFNTNQTDPSQNAYWLATNGRKLFAYYGDSRELIAFQN